MNRKSINYIFCAFALLCFSCEDIVPEEDLIYFNDFDNGDYAGISGVKISSFDGDFVMGNFNNNGFQLSLDNLPDHEYVRVSFDLYIHDSWDGNTNGTNPLGEDHDAWILEFDPNENLKSSEKLYFETTFSNGLCIPGFCYSQSYPREFPFPNDSKLEAFSTSLPGLCAWKDSPNGTSLYKFDKVFLHKRNSTTISFYDRLVQPNSDNPLCDESWSLDNLSISVFKKR
ncbi:hypothetical protein [Roseivirga sp.]|uniref:hypothetical protein n=1 Tax=Roseivirga sp. TaxID=1964215 RepID=UPI002B26A1EF|nr:hypothetical protein [Roseivirga sp.]